MGTVATDILHTHHAGLHHPCPCGFCLCRPPASCCPRCCPPCCPRRCPPCGARCPRCGSRCPPRGPRRCRPRPRRAPPYTYTYAVADDYSKANFQQSESNDGTGVVSGSYSVNLPDGRIQTVTYNANDLTGNIAEVTYSGEAVYPPAPAGGYVAAAPVHAVHAVSHPVVHHAPVLAHAVHAAPVHAVHHGLAHGVVAHGGLVHHG